jgi:hypothetical protein
MRAWLVTVSAGVLIAGGVQTATAQGTTAGTANDQSSVATGHITETRSTAGASPPFRSRLRIHSTRQIDTSPRPGVNRHGGQLPFGVIPLWPVVPLVPPPVVVPLQVDTELRGGVQLDVQPWRAEVFVDGAYAGVVEDFKGYYNHLELTPGPHALTIVAPDYFPLTFELIVLPRRTITHRATLNRSSGR